jgi:hypothetical protein
LNWNTSDFCTHDPTTLAFGRRVGESLKLAGVARKCGQQSTVAKSSSAPLHLSRHGVSGTTVSRYAEGVSHNCFMNRRSSSRNSGPKLTRCPRPNPSISDLR